MNCCNVTCFVFCMNRPMERSGIILLPLFGLVRRVFASGKLNIVFIAMATANKWIALILSMTPEAVMGFALAPGSALPDSLFFACGVLIGGLGGILQAASRSLMVRHTNPDAPTESFGLYGLSGRATAFLAPMLIGIVTVATDDVRVGVAPLIVLFLLGLVLLFWVKPDGDRAVP